MLSESQESAFRQIICDKRPEQLTMEFALWNHAAVMQLVKRKCAIKLSVRGVGNYFKRWGFTPQKPIKNAYEQRPEAAGMAGQRISGARATRQVRRSLDSLGRRNSGCKYRRAWPLLRTGRRKTDDVCGRRHTPEIVDYCHRHQSGQNMLDDY